MTKLTKVGALPVAFVLACCSGGLEDPNLKGSTKEMARAAAEVVFEKTCPKGEVTELPASEHNGKLVFKCQVGSGDVSINQDATVFAFGTFLLGGDPEFLINVYDWNRSEGDGTTTPYIVRKVEESYAVVRTFRPRSWEMKITGRKKDESGRDILTICEEHCRQGCWEACFDFDAEKCLSMYSQECAEKKEEVATPKTAEPKPAFELPAPASPREPKKAKLALNEGRNLVASGNFAGAVERFKEAYRLDSDNTKALGEMAFALLKLERWADAAVASQRGIDIGADDKTLGAFYFNLGWARSELGDKAGAIKAYEKSLEHRPGNKTVEKRLAELR